MVQTDKSGFDSPKKSEDAKYIRFCRTIDITVIRCAAGDGQIAPGSFDSLGAVEMANGLSSALGLKLPQTLVFDYPSVKGHDCVRP